MHCHDCGAAYEATGDNCAARFAQLLALDHSREEPWGSRHGLAFATYALQHPTIHSAGSRATSWYLLQRVFAQGADLAHVVRVMRGAPGAVPNDVPVPVLPAGDAAARSFVVTIKDLGDFDALTYARRLDEWCRATLTSYGAAVRPEARRG